MSIILSVFPSVVEIVKRYDLGRDGKRPNESNEILDGLLRKLLTEKKMSS